MANLFKPKMPTIQPPKPMPDPEDPQRAAASQRKVATQAKTSGTASTRLTAGGAETLGG